MDSERKEMLDSLRALKLKASELAVCAGVAEAAVSEGWADQNSGIWRKNYDRTCNLAADVKDLLVYFNLL